MNSEKGRVYHIDREGNRVAKSVIPEKKSPGNSLDLTGRYFNLGYYLLVPIFAGLLVGVGLDKWLSTKPTFTIIFILCGTFSTFYNLFKILRHD